MKLFILFVIGISIIPVSIAGMVWGWGLTPENWVWVAFSYLWVYVSQFITESLG